MYLLYLLKDYIYLIYLFNIWLYDLIYDYIYIYLIYLSKGINLRRFYVSQFKVTDTTLRYNSVSNDATVYVYRRLHTRAYVKPDVPRETSPREKRWFEVGA